MRTYVIEGVELDNKVKMVSAASKVTKNLPSDNGKDARIQSRTLRTVLQSSLMFMPDLEHSLNMAYNGHCYMSAIQLLHESSIGTSPSCYLVQERLSKM